MDDVGRVVLPGGSVVCSAGFDDAEAGVICRMLGYSGGAAVQGGLEHDPASAYYSDQFSCGGSENSIMQCHHKSENYCSSGRDAGVVCSSEKRDAPA